MVSPQFQGLGQAVVHSRLGRVQVGVGADGGHALLRQSQQDLPRHALIGEGLHRVEDHRMVGHDELAPQLHSLLHHFLGDVQGHQQGADFFLPPAHQKARVIKVHLGLKGARRSTAL